jgi:hypothetical protein
MKLLRSLGRRWLFLLVLLVLAGATKVRSEGPMNVGGPQLPPPDPNKPTVLGGPAVPGAPFIWKDSNPLTYWTDPGPSGGGLALGNLTAAQADSLVQQAFQVWQDVPTASINFSKAGSLSKDVTASNILSVLNQLSDCAVAFPADSVAKDRTIVYDADGSAIKAMGDDPTMILGEASPVCFTSDGTNNFYQRGFAILNGKPLTSGQATRADLEATMVHELGHLIGLDHSQINLNCLTDFSCPADDLAGVPIMFPVAVTGTRTTLSTYDVAGVSVLYPETVNKSPTQVAFNTMGRIQGRVLFSDGPTPAQGFNVIARQVDDPSTPTVNESRRIAVSNVSGFLFTEDAGNSAVPDSLTENPFGSRDPSLIGFFDIPGLPVDNGKKYTLEVEAIHNSDPNPFVGGSSVGPIGNVGFQFLLVAPCSPVILSGTTTTCDPTQKTHLQPQAGQILNTGTNVVLIGTTGTLLRYDAWEDGP